MYRRHQTAATTRYQRTRTIDWGRSYISSAALFIYLLTNEGNDQLIQCFPAELMLRNSGTQPGHWTDKPPIWPNQWYLNISEDLPSDVLFGWDMGWGHNKRWWNACCGSRVDLPQQIMSKITMWWPKDGAATETGNIVHGTCRPQLTRLFQALLILAQRYIDISVGRTSMLPLLDQIPW